MQERIYQAKIKEYEADFLKDLKKLVACRSVRDTELAQPGAPFGPGIQEAFAVFLDIAARLGFICRNFNGYACDAQMGDSKDYVGILGHLDVVPEGDLGQWHTEPYTLTLSAEGVLYGRGVNDDKGPLLASLYAVRILKDLGTKFDRSVRIIAGGAEETTWECMEHYFRKNPQPVMGFSPDGDFPIVNGEKGILKYELIFPGEGERFDIECSTFENYVCDQVRLVLPGENTVHTFNGKRALSRNPWRGDNAIWKLAAWMADRKELPAWGRDFAAFIQDCMAADYYGNKSGLYTEDVHMGATSVCPTGVSWQEDGIHLYLDIRYPRTITEKELCRRLEKLGNRYHFQTGSVSGRKPLYVEEDSPLIRGLKQAYEAVTGEPARLLTKGGASYARVLNNGVAFGAAFEGEDTLPHMPNECARLVSLEKAMEIYCAAVAILARI